MKNFICGAIDKDNDTFNKLNVKIFLGSPKEVEKEIQEFINTNPIEIERALQSESGVDDFSITVTLFYYSEGKAQFIDERWTITMLSDKIVDEIENQYTVSFTDIMLDILDRKG